MKKVSPLRFFDLYIPTFFVTFFGFGGFFLLYPARLAIRVPFAFLHILADFVLST